MLDNLNDFIAAYSGKSNASSDLAGALHDQLGNTNVEIVTYVFRLYFNQYRKTDDPFGIVLNDPFGMVYDITMSVGNAASYLDKLGYMFTYNKSILGTEVVNNITTAIDGYKITAQSSGLDFSSLVNLWIAISGFMITSSTMNETTSLQLTTLFLAYTKTWMDINYSDALTTIWEDKQITVWCDELISTLNITVATGDWVKKSLEYEDDGSLSGGLTGFGFKNGMLAFYNYAVLFLQDTPTSLIAAQTNAFLSSFSSQTTKIKEIALPGGYLIDITGQFGLLGLVLPGVTNDSIKDIVKWVLGDSNYSKVSVAIGIYLDSLGVDITYTVSNLIDIFLYIQVEIVGSTIYQNDDDTILDYADKINEYFMDIYEQELTVNLNDSATIDKVDFWSGVFVSSLGLYKIDDLIIYYADIFLTWLFEMNNMSENGVCVYNVLEIGIEFIEFIATTSSGISSDTVDNIAKTFQVLLTTIINKDQGETPIVISESPDVNEDELVDDEDINDGTIVKDEITTEGIVGIVIGSVISIAISIVGAYCKGRSRDPVAAALTVGAVATGASAVTTLTELLQQLGQVVGGGGSASTTPVAAAVATSMAEETAASGGIATAASVSTETTTEAFEVVTETVNDLIDTFLKNIDIVNL